MKSLTIAAVALMLTAGLAQAQTIRMGTEGAYAPYNFIDDATGEFTGFEIELGALAQLVAQFALEASDLARVIDEVVGRVGAFGPEAHDVLRLDSAADVQTLRDGSLLVSDDVSGALIRITYGR